MSAQGSLTNEARKWLVEKRKTDFLVHVEIIRYMLSSLQDHFGSKHRTPKLCLRWCRQHLKTLTEFNLLFCDCTYRQGSENGYRWQWRCLEIFITSNLVSRILELEPSSIDTYDAASSFRLPNQEDKKRPSRQFLLQEFRNILAADDADDEGALTYPTSLIRTRTLAYYLSLSPEDPDDKFSNAKFQLDISYALTEALILFYKTSMMPRPWTEDTIEFMFCKEHENGQEFMSVVTRMPLMSVPTEPDPTEDDISILTSRFNALSLEGPKFPEIKALGVLLLQIWLNMPMAKLSRQHPGFFNGTVTRIEETALCHSLDTGILRHLSAELQPVCKVVERCFNDEVFEGREGVEIDIEIDRQLLVPLEHLKEAWEAREAKESDGKSDKKGKSEKSGKKEEGQGASVPPSEHPHAFEIVPYGWRHRSGN